MNKPVVALCLAALLAGAAFVGYSVSKARIDQQSKAASPASGGSESKQQEGQAQLPSSIPATDDEAGQLVALNQLILEVAQENAERPKDQRMTSEEIKALVKSRVEELQGQQ